MKCSICNRDNLTERELALHTRFFHKPKVVAPVQSGAVKLLKIGQQAQKVVAGVCPDCGSTLWYQEGCASCQVCGFSKCG